MRRNILLLSVLMLCHPDLAPTQMPPGNPIEYPKTITVTITNPLDISRPSEPVIIPMADIQTTSPDFNRTFFRVKRLADDGFEPLDIPSQIRLVPAAGYGEELVFLVDLAPREKKTLEIVYNPSGTEAPRYPEKTQAFEKWYTGGVNVAWENEVNAYRSYNGLLDYFAKSFAHLRLHDLPADSYHHEETWGVDPFVIGGKPGLCGLALVEGNTLVPLYAGKDSLSYVHRAFGGGAVCAGAAVKTLNRGELILEQVFSLFDSRHENHVRIIPSRKNSPVAVGMQANDGETVRFNARAGYLVSWAPAGEYGTIAHVTVFNPADFIGKTDTPQGHFLTLKPDASGAVSCLSLGAWYRVSAGQPKSQNALLNHAAFLAKCFSNPVKVDMR